VISVHLKVRGLDLRKHLNYVSLGNFLWAMLIWEKTQKVINLKFFFKVNYAR